MWNISFFFHSQAYVRAPTYQIILPRPVFSQTPMAQAVSCPTTNYDVISQQPDIAIKSDRHKWKDAKAAFIGTLLTKLDLISWPVCRPVRLKRNLFLYIIRK